ncbi:MAG: histidine--tRNA ligase, partial [Hyphomicrobiales bacterium]
MAKPKKPARPKARLPRGFIDAAPADLRAERAMLETIRRVYENYGFEPLETPAIEYTDALGKFLPDLDRPNEGVFSFQDDDEQWMSLRYDLTAPLARYVAQNFNDLPKPFRRYQVGPVWRNEKPGPGRFRQFTQFDADTVGAPSVAADAEMCMLAADAMEALGIPRGQYVIKVNNRKVLDGVLESIGVTDDGQRLTVMRALDKYDRLGSDAVKFLLGDGRKDESGDFTKGAQLKVDQIMRVMAVFDAAWRGDGKFKDASLTSKLLRDSVGDSQAGLEGVEELDAIAELVATSGYLDGRIQIDPSVVRGLEYYTGPVFEAELTFEVKSKEGGRFGSVGGGGRYDGLIERFTGQKVPATGFSVGVSRL